MLVSKFLSRSIAVAALSVVTLAAHAAAPMQKTQAPGWYRSMIGDFEVTALYDGYLDLDTQLMKHVQAAEIERDMARAFQPSGNKIRTSVNAFLVNTGAKLILIDTGAGNAFGPTLGFAVRNLKAAGYDPADVDKVLLTHMHGDHLGGILSTDGKIAFPNAALMPTRAESEYWLDAARMAQAPKEARGSFEMAAKTAAPYRAAGQWKPFDSNADIEPGIRAFATGHTPGHTSYIIESKGQRLIVLGDVIHFGSVQFPRPDISVVFDTDSAPAITSRKKLFAAAAKDQTLLAGAHLSFPGLGHIRAQGQGYVWVPVEFSPLR